MSGADVYLEVAEVDHELGFYGFLVGDKVTWVWRYKWWGWVVRRIWSLTRYELSTIGPVPSTVPIPAIPVRVVGPCATVRGNTSPMNVPAITATGTILRSSTSQGGTLVALITGTSWRTTLRAAGIIRRHEPTVGHGGEQILGLELTSYSKTETEGVDLACWPGLPVVVVVVWGIVEWVV